MEAFAREHGAAPRWLVRSPGRVNLIGEHTDYSGGFVLPMAIDRSVWLALSPCAGRNVRVRSLDAAGGAITIPLDASPRKAPGWAAYVAGAAWALRERGLPLRVWSGAIASDVPIGAGLASSAALAVALVSAFAIASGLDLSATECALAAWSAETEATGVRCGVMDPLIASCGIPGHALLIDCRSLATEAVPIPSDCAILLLDTGARRKLAATEYNARRAQCERVSSLLGVAALRDVALDDLERFRDRLGPTLFRRARHVVSENARVLEAERRLRCGDVAALGGLVDESHASLRDDFEVSSAELDAMVRSVRAEASCYGARMMGAGFGGTVVALAAAGGARAMGERALLRYASESSLTPALYEVRPAAGAETIAVTSSAGD